MPPSVKTIAAGLQIDAVKAKQIRTLMECKNECGIFHTMQAIDIVLGTYGVEYISDNGEGYARCTGLEYCNTGDTYDTTVIYDNRNGRFYISSWGYMVEKQEKRFRDC